jgi:hypothetical protein
MQKVECKAQIYEAKLGKKDGRRAEISSVGRKLLYEIHPRAGIAEFNFSLRKTAARSNLVMHLIYLQIESGLVY